MKMPYSRFSRWSRSKETVTQFVLTVGDWVQVPNNSKCLVVQCYGDSVVVIRATSELVGTWRKYTGHTKSTHQAGKVSKIDMDGHYTFHSRSEASETFKVAVEFLLPKP